jgi:hypothetical protein
MDNVDWIIIQVRYRDSGMVVEVDPFFAMKRESTDMESEE